MVWNVLQGWGAGDSMETYRKDRTGYHTRGTSKTETAAKTAASEVLKTEKSVDSGQVSAYTKREKL